MEWTIAAERLPEDMEEVLLFDEETGLSEIFKEEQDLAEETQLTI
ncbi:MAG TPA: hypothetical protein VF602_04185 [Pedobacter sp.]